MFSKLKSKILLPGSKTVFHVEHRYNHVKKMSVCYSHSKAACERSK
ncbi:Uncharacterised protein [Legionella sainthelensi]|nr:Uncharacterised protein [Legionella sainthelensi]